MECSFKYPERLCDMHITFIYLFTALFIILIKTTQTLCKKNCKLQQGKYRILTVLKIVVYNNINM